MPRSAIIAHNTNAGLLLAAYRRSRPPALRVRAYRRFYRRARRANSLKRMLQHCHISDAPPMITRFSAV